MFRTISLAGALALALSATSAAYAQAPAPVVKLKQGAVSGQVTEDSAVFLGIPYAAAPLGDLRWKPPAAAPGWSGTRDGTKAGASCDGAEDCLYLNVTTPVGARPGQKLPVMVWIHGGAFVVGTSLGAFGAQHDGSEFAKKGIITVTLNYRLGRAGWFAHPALDREGHEFGNYGLMDQIAALKWVQANIGAFGGDAKNVTVFGESAGGISILYLMLAPEAKGLFAKAIGESSFPRHEPFSLKQAEDQGIKAAEGAGVKGDDAAAAAALRKLPLTALPYSGPFTSRAQPIEDGKLISSGVMEGFQAGRQAKVPLIIGGNSDEASLFRPTPAMLDQMPEAKRAAMLRAYDPSGTGDKTVVVHQMATDQYITEPDRALARIEAKDKVPVWTYYFSYAPAAEADTRRGPSYGAVHTAEIRFVFGGPRQHFTGGDEALSKSMNAYWAAFAKSGDPDSAGGPAWPRFDAAKEAQIEFGEGGVKVHDHLFKARLDATEAAAGKDSGSPR